MKRPQAPACQGQVSNKGQEFKNLECFTSRMFTWAQTDKPLSSLCHLFWLVQSFLLFLTGLTSTHLNPVFPIPETSLWFSSVLAKKFDTASQITQQACNHQKSISTKGILQVTTSGGLDSTGRQNRTSPPNHPLPALPRSLHWSKHFQDAEKQIPEPNQMRIQLLESQGTNISALSNLKWAVW